MLCTELSVELAFVISNSRSHSRRSCWLFSRSLRRYNFALLGNPGTGKTTVGKLLARMLKELGVRPSANFVPTTGEKLARMGAAAVGKLIDDATGGCLFIDEAYALDPASNADAASVAMQLLDVAEERREKLTIVLAGLVTIALF
jgi:ABC-type glutathione transport system ATPase component